MCRVPDDARARASEGDLSRERAWLVREVLAAEALTEDERVRILEDLFQTSEAIRAGKTTEEIQREEAARRLLDGPGRRRYEALAERLE